MHHSLRLCTALGFLGWVTMAFALHGCTSRLGPVRATQSAGSVGHPNLQDIVLEKSAECVADYAQQMAPGRVVLPSTVEVNEGGDKLSVTIDGIPNTAPDLGACLRNVLRYMPIAEQPLREGVGTLKFHIEHASDSQEALKRFIEVIPGVPIVESEMVLEAEGYTVVLPVTVKVVAKLQKLIDGDKDTLSKIGQMALGSVGYEEIMRLAREQGWLKSVRKRQPKATAGKGLIAQSETEVVVVMFEVFTEYAVTAGVVSQLDSPLPGPADVVAIGFLALGLYKAGAVGLTALSTATAPAPTSSPPTPPPPPPPPPPPRETCEANSELNKIIRCDDRGISNYNFFSETEAFKSIKVKGIKMEKSKAKATDGPCENRGGWHTNVKRGKEFVASILGCYCCEDSSGKAVKNEKARVRYH